MEEKFATLAAWLICCIKMETIEGLTKKKLESQNKWSERKMTLTPYFRRFGLQERKNILKSLGLR